MVCRTRYDRDKGSQGGFSLVELTAALIVIMLIMLVGYRLTHAAYDADRFYKTVVGIQELGVAIVGNAELVQTGHQASFGFYEHRREFSFFDGLQASVVPDEFLGRPVIQYNLGGSPYNDYELNGWGEGYSFTRNAGILEIDGSGGAPETVQYDITEGLFDNNRVRLYIKDAEGAVLLGSDGAFLPPDLVYHIAQIRMVRQGAVGLVYDYTPGGVGNEINWEQAEGSFETVVLIPAGFYLVEVTPTSGGGGIDGLHDQRYLCGYDGNAGEDDQTVKCVVVYPCGQFFWQKIEVRLPGVLDPTKVMGGDVSVD